MRINRFAVERFANESVGFHEVDAIGVAEIAEPERGEVTEIAKAALGGEDGEFELIFVEIGFGGDFEGAAVVFCAADDDERAFDRLFLSFDTEHREFVLQDFDGTLPPVGEDSHFCFQLEVHGVSDAAVGTSAGDAEEIAALVGLFERSGEAKRNFSNGTAHEAFGGLRNIPRQSELFGENVCRAAGKKSERNTMAILLAREAVDDFVERAVATAGDDELAAFLSGAQSDFGGVARAGCLGKVGFDSAGGENFAGFVQFFSAGLAAAPGVGVVNQERVAQVCCSFHWFVSFSWPD